MKAHGYGGHSAIVKRQLRQAIKATEPALAGGTDFGNQGVPDAVAGDSCIVLHRPYTYHSPWRSVINLAWRIECPAFFHPAHCASSTGEFQQDGRSIESVV